MDEQRPTVGGKLPHQRVTPFGVRLSTHRMGARKPKLTPEQRDELVKKIRALFEEEPEISLTEVGRRLSPSYPVAGATIANLARTVR